ncbi:MULTISPECIES: hypothetical protein [Stutzerimonas stutzeri subgroup]|jgi:hypothetical protein|uniref:Uncharacterized protein n=1 Tax=Stutzerimonas stutzeri NF13 TaxID=1212548 RepID=M2TSR6_STUST|nr:MULTISPECIES: hypothetical protein [Stutzerimonas stutzeri subgroup]EME00341.1 hypothetical protein B381_09356 [Stutzerimonas stutzeri NF13]MBK3882946.1 hypothetical protein [Stutzerimonas stutzeri]MCQ4290426.1 hypothetical protein [Stutzerimonas stutzeri]WOF79353.1 hypothetical protein P5704_002270 [Pseudomonas sp. FeN3W]
MKAHLHLLLVLLLSLALPVSSMAALELRADPCQMQSDMETSGHFAHQAEAQDEGAHSHESSPLCKSGHQCKTGSMLQTGVAQPQLAVSLPQLAVHYSEFFPARSNADVWRPPRY